jgi:hypothetical protein
MYMGEAQLIKVLRRAVEESGVISDVPPMHMLFCCLALSHQEDLYSQKLAVKLWKMVKNSFSVNDEIHKYEKVFDNNLKIIDELGRFPQRNKLLGRQPTPAEEEWQGRKRSEQQMMLQRAAVAAGSGGGGDDGAGPGGKKKSRMGIFQSLIGRGKKQQVEAQ